MTINMENMEQYIVCATAILEGGNIELVIWGEDGPVRTELTPFKFSILAGAVSQRAQELCES